MSLAEELNELGAVEAHRLFNIAEAVVELIASGWRPGTKFRAFGCVLLHCN